jgi:hypothetical protein
MTSPSARRTQIIEQLAHLDTMEYGSLRTEHRRASGGGTTGPYFQHQVWEHGKNLSQRIRADEAAALQTAIANRQLAEALAQEYIAVTVQLTRESADEANPAKKTHDRGGVRPCGSRSVPESRTAATQRRRLDGLRVGGNGLARCFAAGRQAVAGKPAQRSGSAVAGRCQPAGRKMQRWSFP